MVTRQKIIVMALSLAFLTTYSLAFKGDELPPADYKGLITERPIFYPGEYWIFSKTDGKSVKWTYEGEENGLFIFVSGERKDRLYKNADLLDIKQINGKTGEVLFQRTERDINKGYLNFPLWIGKKWSDEHISRSPRKSSFHANPTINNYEVIGYETTTVKAGIFASFRIRCYWQTMGNSKSKSGIYEVWYAPNVKNIIRSDRKEYIELLDYKIQ